MAIFTVQPTILKIKTPLEFSETYNKTPLVFSEMHKKVVQFFPKYHIDYKWENHQTLYLPSPCCIFPLLRGYFSLWKTMAS